MAGNVGRKICMTYTEVIVLDDHNRANWAFLNSEVEKMKSGKLKASSDEIYSLESRVKSIAIVGRKFNLFRKAMSSGD